MNEVLRQVVAEELERLADADDRLRLLTVTGVVSEPDLRHAKVLFALLEPPAEEALGEARIKLQAAIASQVRMKRTPMLAFSQDPAIVQGNRIEEILRRVAEADSAANEPAANEPAANEPAANEPAANEPAANEPAANEPDGEPVVIERPDGEPV